MPPPEYPVLGFQRLMTRMTGEKRRPRIAESAPIGENTPLPKVGYRLARLLGSNAPVRFVGGGNTIHTRVKICGLTQAKDVRAAVVAGADAIGLVFYPPSPRYVGEDAAAELARALPPFVMAVGLFVNAEPSVVRETLAAVPIHLLQFHGDEDDAYCQQFRRPYIKALRVTPGMDIASRAAAFPGAGAILLDAFVDSYGGGGEPFDWALIPSRLRAPIILSGGLDSSNVGQAIRRIRPAAVDVSSGVETGRGIKDAAKIRAFVDAARAADIDGQPGG